MHRIDPVARQIGQGFKVLWSRRHLGLEPAHGTCRGCAMLPRPPTNELPHHRIAAKTVGVVNILVSGEAREDRLAQEPREPVAAILAGAGIGNRLCRHVHHSEGVNQFAME